MIRRRRWANVGAVYLLLLIFSIGFMGPFLFAALSSLKDDPLEWPPRITVNQLKLSNWIAAYKLGKAGGGGGFFGAFAPGAVVPFEVTYKVAPGKEPVVPEVVIPRRIPGSAAAALLLKEFAADYAEVSEIKEVEREVLEDGSTLVTYRFEIRHTGDIVIDRLPLDITVPFKQIFVKGTLDPNRIERLGRVQSWDNITSGVIPYIFHNYHRVFSENYSRSTGKNLFMSWIFNSFYLAFVRVITTLLFASMAGYALARLKFAGKNTIFVFMLFSMMIPGQVTFISNYLVLRDGIFGISKLFGMDSLLNTYTGLIISGLVGASAVFIMKQFFEGLPVSLEESARIDGANTYQIFFKIMLPLAKPALGALTILTFQGVWNEFFWPLVVLTSPQDKFTLTLGLLNFRQTYAVAFDWGPMLAGAIISALPIIILFIVFQKYFIEGISFTGIKG
ncbi:ABC transporter permease [Anoxybacter fermentans]|uniref:ABC transporter permease n=2 Tax=Anoxybacter fermentans TaxID=1323375 RepID=A0A3Q9HSS4_9FIRM|nr:ABC transporter permease [Anoxybacter fermentans]